MPFQMPCTNKTCGKLQNPYMDPKTEEVFCSICDVKIENITHFAKVQIKALKQYREKKKVSFAVKCPNCNKEGRPIITYNPDDIVCGGCSKPLDHLTDFFKKMLRVQLKNADQEV